MDIRELRGWMYRRLLPNKKDWTQEFVTGVQQFIDYVSMLPQYERDGGMRCPCIKCKNRKFLTNEQSHLHLLKYGFMENYYYWTNHGEHEPQDLHGATSSHSRPTMNEMTNYENMVFDAVGRNADDYGQNINDEIDPNVERVWVNELAKKSHEIHTQKMTEISSQSSNTEDGEPANSTPTELEVWTEIVGGPKKGRLRGLGSQGSFDTRSSYSTSRFDMQNWQTEKTELLNRVVSYETENTELRQQVSRLTEFHSKQQEDLARQQGDIARQQSDIAFLKAQFAMLQQQQQVGGSSYYPPPARPPNSGRGYTSYKRSRLSKFMPTPGGSSASHDAPPPDPPYEEPDDDNGEQEPDT